MATFTPNPNYSGEIIKKTDSDLCYRLFQGDWIAFKASNTAPNFDTVNSNGDVYRTAPYVVDVYISPMIVQSGIYNRETGDIVSWDLETTEDKLRQLFITSSYLTNSDNSRNYCTDFADCDSSGKIIFTYPPVTHPKNVVDGINFVIRDEESMGSVYGIWGNNFITMKRTSTGQNYSMPYTVSNVKYVGSDIDPNRILSYDYNFKINSVDSLVFEPKDYLTFPTTNRLHYITSTYKSKDKLPVTGCLVITHARRIE